MQQLLNKKWMAWVVLLLLILNISALGTILYFTHFHGRPPAEEAGPAVMPGEGMLVRELGFNEVQKDSLRKSREALFNETMEKRHSMREKRRELITEIAKDNPDTNLLSAISDSMVLLQSDLREATIHHVLRIKKICSAEQAKRLTGFYQDLFFSERPGLGPGAGRQFRMGQGRPPEQGPMRDDSSPHPRRWRGGQDRPGRQE